MFWNLELHGSYFLFPKVMLRGSMEVFKSFRFHLRAFITEHYLWNDLSFILLSCLTPLSYQLLFLLVCCVTVWMKARFFFFVHFVSPCSWILPVCPNTVNFPSLPTLASVSSVRRFVITVRGLLPGKHSSCLCFKNPAYRSTGCSTHVGFICERNSLLGLEYPFYPFDSTFVKKNDHIWSDFFVWTIDLQHCFADHSGIAECYFKR